MTRRHPTRKPTSADEPPLRIGVSTCLLGQKVRWDGNHKRDTFVTEALAPFVEFVAVCPEVEMGLGIPREPIRLQAAEEGPRLVATDSRRDLTARMDRFAERRVRQLHRQGLSGYILKKDSPSCGLERVRVWPEKGQARKNGVGRFVASLQAHWPELPLEEEGRLRDPDLRERWLERVFASWRVQCFFGTRWTLGSLVAFHTREKLQLMAHSPVAYRELGRLVAEAKSLTRPALRDAYSQAHHAALAKPASRGRHMNVLEHALGYFRDQVDVVTRDDLHGRARDYREGRIPRWVPVMLIRHTAMRLDLSYLTEQVYFDPHPAELTLRPWL